MKQIPLVTVNEEGQLGSFSKGVSAFQDIVRKQTVLANQTWEKLPNNNELDYEVI